jgi:tRNA(Ile)-lysidine synthase
MRGARPERAIEAAFDRAVGASDGETLLAAVSGGSDSAALAALAARHAGARGARLVLGHVNHGVRPEARRDEGVALALGASLGARVLVRHLAPGKAAEARLRELRYAALAVMARGAGASRVLTAHHAEDQTETVLLALFRGAGPVGLGGMAPVRRLARGIDLVRPLLRVPKARLGEYCAFRRLPYAVDASNADTGFRRNALRRSLAELRGSFPDLDAAVARWADLTRADRARTPRAELRAALRANLERELGDVRDVGSERVEAVAIALEAGRTGRHFVRSGVEIVVRRPS